jgi:hypothetical protein
VRNKEQSQQSVYRNWRTINQVNKEEEKHEDLGGAIDPEKPMACSASLCRDLLFYAEQGRDISWDLLAL